MKNHNGLHGGAGATTADVFRFLPPNRSRWSSAGGRDHGGFSGAKGDSIAICWCSPTASSTPPTKMQDRQRSGLIAVRTVVGQSWNASDHDLEDRQITVEGPFMARAIRCSPSPAAPASTRAAKGSMKLHPRDAKATSYDFTYDLAVMAYTLEHCLRSRRDFPALTKNPGLAFLDGRGQPGARTPWSTPLRTSMRPAT